MAYDTKAKRCSLTVVINRKRLERMERHVRTLIARVDGMIERETARLERRKRR